MSKKCFANYVCSKCATMINDTFEYNTVKEALNHTIICPVCKRKGVQTTSPESMKQIILLLLQKGYHVFNIYENTLCIVIMGRFENIGKLPDEFTLDRTEDIGDIILNERLKADDFDGLDKDEYIKEALDNLLKWVQNLDIVNNNPNAYVVIDETEKLESNTAEGFADAISPYPIKNGIACKYTWNEVNEMYDNLPNEEKEKYTTLESFIDTLFDPVEV